LKRVSLVLGSGGARGLTHIGVIRALVERGYQIDYIAGSSIGALIGGIYAAGKLEDYADWVATLRRRDIVRLMDFSFSRGAMLSGDRIIEVLRELVGDHAIETLPIGFTAVATEINDKREIWLNRGSLFDAIRASIALPLVFAPVERDGMLLVDGGVINPVPIAPTLNNDAAYTIVVDLNARAESIEERTVADEVEQDEESPLRHAVSDFLDRFVDDETPPGEREGETASPGAIDVALRSLDTMQTTIGRMKLAAYAPWLIIDIPRNLCTLFEFDRALELIEFGYARAHRVLDDLERE
jgi:NTE family protein